MEFEKIKNVSVIGAGMMGSQLAELFARVGGYPVTMWDLEENFVKGGLESLESRLKKFFVDKGKMSAQQLAEIMGRIKTTTNLAAAVKNADYVVEAVLENTKVKKDIFKQLDEHARPDVVLSTNTSGLNITEIASATKHPQRVAGMHFFNPPGMMKLVEVVRGALSSDETVNLIVAMSRKLQKEPVICKDFSYGFLANRAYRAMRDEAVRMVWERVGSPEDIDKSLKLGYNLPVGPLELADTIGSWGVAGAAEEDAMREMGPERGHLHPLARMMYRAGYLGGRSGKGIYAFWKDVLSKG